MVFGAVQAYQLAHGQCSADTAWEQEEETLYTSTPPSKGEGVPASLPQL